MKIAVPREIKNNEFRVAMTPAGVRELTNHGHQVLIEKGAGEGSGMSVTGESQRGTWGAVS